MHLAECIAIAAPSEHFAQPTPLREWMGVHEITGLPPVMVFAFPEQAPGWFPVSENQVDGIQFKIRWIAAVA